MEEGDEKQQEKSAKKENYQENWGLSGETIPEKA